MPQAHVEVEQFIAKHKPDVVVYDVPMPYGSSPTPAKKACAQQYRRAPTYANKIK